MPLKQLEKKLTTMFSSIWKDNFGKGAIETKVKVVGDTIFVKYRTQFSPLEKMLMGKLKDSVEDVTTLFRDCEDLTQEQIQKRLEPILGKGVKVIGVYINPAIEQDISFQNILLDTNIERLVTKPSKECDQDAV